MSEEAAASAEPLGLRALLLFDPCAPQSAEQARIAGERVRSLAVSIPFLGASHLLWSLFLLGAIFAETGRLSLVALPVLGVLLLDVGLWRALHRPAAPAHRKVLLAFAHCAATALMWGAAILILRSSGDGASLAARAALVAAFGAGIATFFAIPALLILSCLVTVGGIALMKGQPALLGIAAAASLFLMALSVTRARDLILAARQRLAAEWEAKKARRFIAAFEGSGRGWFWETNADGAVTYLSETLARRIGLGEGAARGRGFEDLLLKENEAGEEARKALSFHLSARFPFSDVLVRAPGAEEGYWSISGSPSFDEYGRFMGFRGMGANLSEEQRAEAERSNLAHYDSLTGLPNRAMMRASLEEAVANAAARHKGCALMMIDLDRFKQVNDTLGHPAGDKLLKQVAQRLKDVLGQEGQVGRLGGDEFEAILPGIAEDTRLGEIAGRMIEEVSRPYAIDGHKVEIGTSIGIAIGRPGKSYANGLIKDADLALYASKAAGRGTYRFFAPEMHVAAAERQIFAADLRDALAKDQLRLLYQPIVGSVSEEVVCLEALLRWQHPTRGILPPAEVIPLAEECGLMPKIGAWVIRSACDEAARWPAHVRVAVNLSAGQLADPGLPSIVTGAVAASGIEPGRLELEISEGAFPADGAGPNRMLARLKAIGVRLVLDNFGTGQSGLGHLRDAPLDKIKIDRSFVRGAGQGGSRNAAIIRAIVVLAESLGMDTTAEGAETLEELALIRRLGCSQVQGFLFGKPMPPSEAAARAASSKPTAVTGGFSRPPRHRLIRNGILHHEGESLPVRLRNISAGGAMAECDLPLPTGAKVVLDLDEAGRLPAEVRWCERGNAGFRFAEPFQLRRLSRVRAGAGGLKMLTPAYLDVVGEGEEAQPPARRKAASKAGRK